MISIKTVSEKYETFCGEKLSRFLLKYVVIMVLLFTSFNFNRNVEQSRDYITRGIIIFLVQFLNVGKSIYKVIKKDQKDLEESFSNFKLSYAITYISMVVFIGLYCIFTEVMLARFETYNFDILQMILNFEGCLFLIGIIPLIFTARSYKLSVQIFILLEVIFAKGKFINFQPTVLLLVIYAILILMVTYFSTMLMFKSIRKRIGQGFGLYDRLDKSYRIYTGKPLSNLINFYFIGNVILFLIRLILSKVDSFTTITTSYQTAVIVASMGIFGSIKSEPSELFHRKSCYFLSVKNRLAVYKDYYFITYIGCVINLLVFIVLTYVAGGMRHILPENFYLNLAADIVSLLMLFAIVPFMFTSKNNGILMAKNMLISIAFVPLKLLMVHIHWSVMIVVGIAVIPIMIFSNKRWLTYMTSLYQEI